MSILIINNRLWYANGHEYDAEDSGYDRPTVKPTEYIREQELPIKGGLIQLVQDVSDYSNVKEGDIFEVKFITDFGRVRTTESKTFYPPEYKIIIKNNNEEDYEQ